MDKRKLLFEDNLKTNFQDFNNDFKDNKLKVNDIKNRDQSNKRVSTKQPYEANNKSNELNNKTNSSFSIYQDNDTSYFRKRIEDLQFRVDSQDLKLKAKDKEIQHQQSQIKQYILELHQIQIIEKDYKEQIIALNSVLSQWKDKYFANLKEYQYKLATITRQASQDQNSLKKKYEEIIEQQQKEIEQIELRFENERDNIYKSMELQNKSQHINEEINVRNSLSIQQELISKYDELETENMGLREKILVFEANQDELKFHIQQISGRLLEQVNKTVQLEQQKQQEIQNCQNLLLAKDKQINNLLIQIEESKNDEQYLDQEKLVQLENLNNQLIEQNSQLEDENQKLKTQHSDQFEQENEELKLIIQKQKQQIQKQQQELTQYIQQKNQFEQLSISEANLKSQEQQVEFNAILQQLSQAEQECEKLRQQNHTLQNSISNQQIFGYQKDELLEQIESYVRDIKEKDEVIQSQRINQKEFEKVLAQYRAENKEYKTKNELLSNQNEISTLQIEEILREKQQLQKQLESLANENKLQTKEIQNLQETINIQMRKENDNSLIMKIENLKNKNSILQEQNIMLSQKADEVLEEFEQKTKFYQLEIAETQELYNLISLQLNEKELKLKQLEENLVLQKEHSQQLFENNQTLQEDQRLYHQQLSNFKQITEDTQIYDVDFQNQLQDQQIKSKTSDRQKGFEFNNVEERQEITTYVSKQENNQNEELLQMINDFDLQLRSEKELNENLNLQLQNLQGEFLALQEDKLKSLIQTEKQEEQIKQLTQKLTEQKLLNEDLQQTYQSNLEIELEKNKNTFENTINLLQEEKDQLKQKTIEAIQENIDLQNKLQQFETELLQKQLQLSRIDHQQVVESYENENSNNFELEQSTEGRQYLIVKNEKSEQVNNQQEDDVQVQEFMKDENSQIKKLEQEFEFQQQAQVPLNQKGLREQIVSSFEQSSQSVEQASNQETLVLKLIEKINFDEHSVLSNPKPEQQELFEVDQQPKEVSFNQQQDDPSKISKELANNLINNVLIDAIESVLNLSK
ncbi:unnamed protein product (macronuclear) [Paramecium tetraurelia]|uniref:Uncharacterized protein n=1 Tax=Paramecium tetraurelia TaxID=5888 RepID=A0D1B6_PARTE|nr:uncharacterized protein GSPATT00012357001 [Paramecium tetraurelia]CAK76833.1 unnamed protein product [Paramecium tetraurelia]|eukprot:XP_001444230.1 hypothetical protein (macronuclear) [Paramecium tetraurelia strain d4-2]